MRLLRDIHGLLLLLLASVAFGQPSIEARVLDAVSNEPLPYASVVSMRSGEGVITNEEGVFRMTAVNDNDTLVFSYLGFRSLRSTVAAIRQRSEVRLTPAQTELSAVQVVGRSDALCDLIIACGKHLRQIGRYSGKTYFELETRTSDRPVEGIECFYNGSFNGADVEALDLKQGRIGLLPDHGRFMVSLNTSRAFMLLHPAERNSAFPSTPLQCRSRKALRRAYELNVISITHDPDELYHVRFTPKNNDGTFFHGELWIDAGMATVRTLQLDCDSCRRHPFLPMGPEDELRDVDLHFRQTYSTWEGRSILNTIELAYALTYHTDTLAARLAAEDPGFHNDWRFWSKAVIHVFAPGEKFILPLFYDNAELTDYRKVLSMPYDSAFWENSPRLVRTERQQRDDVLFAKEGLLLGSHRGFGLTGNDRRGLFQSNNAFWSCTLRISFVDVMDSTAYAPLPAKSDMATTMASRMDLVVLLYLNIDETANGYRTFSATVFDGFRSYCHLPDRHHADVLVNLFFDLCEIERRRMQSALAEPGLSLDRIRAIHAEAQKAMDQSTGRFLKETHYGEDPKKLAQWNDKVRVALGVDNFALFGISPEPK